MLPAGRISSAQASAAGSTGSQGCDGRQLVAGDGRGQLHVLLDDVRAVGGHALGEEPARRPLARFGLADQPPATGQARHHRRADRPLQVDHRVVLAGPERRAQSLDFMEGLAAEGSFAPVLGGGKMQVVNQRLRGVAEPLLPGLPSAASSARQRGSTTQSITQSGWACRSAVTAGRACRMSPMAPSRTTSKRKLDCVCKL